ncbi:MAG: cupin domain-containing protein [Halalkalicoccus sp.]
MYTHRSIEDVASQEIDGNEPSLRAIGYELRPEEMRPSVLEYREGASNNRHRQAEQEELYVVLSGRFEMEIDEETVELAEGDVVVVSPDAWRRLTAREDSRVLVVGAPNVKDDGIVYEE